MLRSFAASWSRTAASNLSRTSSDWVLAGATAAAEWLVFFNDWLLLGCGLLFGVERCGDDRIAEHGDHFDDVRDGDADGAGLDEAVAVSKV